MAIQVYDRAFMYLDGVLVAEQENGTLAYQGDPLPVATMGKEFGGVTPVPKSVKIDLSEFVPTTGSSVQKVVDAFLKTKKIKMRVQFGGSGQIGNYEGFLTAPSIATGAADHTKLNYSFIGSANPIS